MGGSGNSQTQASNDAKYPAEFAPLAGSAAKQIQNTQNALPLQFFTAAYPQGVANTSPFQRATMNMLPSTLAPSWGLNQMQNMNPAFNSVMQNATNAANNVNPMYSGALQALSSGGFGQGKQSFPGMPTQFMNLGTPQVQNAPVNQTVAGPNTAGLIQQLQSQLNQPVFANQQLASPMVGPASLLGTGR